MEKLNELLPVLNAPANSVFKTTRDGNTGLYVGKVLIAWFFYDMFAPKDQAEKLHVRSSLPGIKPYQGHRLTEEDAAARCIAVAKTFIQLLNSEPV